MFSQSLKLSHLDEIQNYLSDTPSGLPNVISTSDSTHIYFFNNCSADLVEQNVLLVNKNGNHFRMIIGDDGRFHHCRTWSTLIENDWSVGGLTCDRDDLFDTLALCETGCQNSKVDLKEGLSLLPKEVTNKKRRQAVFRDLMFGVAWEEGLTRFALLPPFQNNPSPPFSGKLWDSAEAACWAEGLWNSMDPANRPGYHEEWTLIPTQAKRQTREQAHKEAQSLYELNPAFGMFG